MAGGVVRVEGHHYTYLAFGRAAAPDNFMQDLKQWSDAAVFGLGGELLQRQTVETCCSTHATNEKYYTIILPLLFECSNYNIARGVMPKTSDNTMIHLSICQ